MSDVHPLLARLLRRCGIEAADLENDPRLQELVRRISRTYVENDEDRYLRERSLDVSSREMQELNAALARERKRLQGEVEVATHLQTSILPRDRATPSYEVAARMVPATEVGGDYYDVIPVAGGCWIGIGDVAGHGLRAAVITTMVQSMTAALIGQRPQGSPRDVVVALNRGIRENVFRRMGFDNHVTMTLFHVMHDGTVTYAGAHEPILVLRNKADPPRCEEIETVGTWLGPMDDIAAATEDRHFHLANGDVLLLHTDGITEARNPQREHFGLARLESRALELRTAPVGALCDGLLATVREWPGASNDDLTILAYRRR